MSKLPEKLAWLLAVFLCVGLPLALGYYGLALVGGASLALLAWRISPWRGGER